MASEREREREVNVFNEPGEELIMAHLKLFRQSTKQHKLRLEFIIKLLFLFHTLTAPLVCWLGSPFVARGEVEGNWKKRKKKFALFILVMGQPDD